MPTNIRPAFANVIAIAIALALALALAQDVACFRDRSIIAGLFSSLEYRTVPWIVPRMVLRFVRMALIALWSKRVY